MELPDDIWTYIKTYVFYPNLWQYPENINFNKMLKEIPDMKCKITSSRPLMLISQHKSHNKFLKIYEQLQMPTFSVLLISYVMVPDNDINDDATFIMDYSTYYDVRYSC
tara:strand:+ start:147 stop:473 length:327 start_codon:yes stop_codon:yes gene_type:complete